MNPKIRKARCFWSLVATAALLLVLLVPPVLADGNPQTNWIGPHPNTLWNNPNNWNNGVPGLDYIAFLNSSTNKTATLKTRQRRCYIR
jgi:hypothetical protein